jgi:adenylyltransferase/sulfurtransferase
VSRADAAVLIVGAGGLGGPIAMALAASGIGALRICDPDSVELSNLQRQIQFTLDDLGKNKATALAARLAARGHHQVEPTGRRFEASTAAALLHEIDMVIDGSDNFATKFAVNDAAVERDIPAVIGAAIGTRGQVLSAIPGGGCYRCLFETPPQTETGTCANAGVLGATCAVIAGEAAAAALALIDGESTAALVVYDDVTASAAPRRIDFERRADCAACARGDRFSDRAEPAARSPRQEAS